MNLNELIKKQNDESKKAGLELVEVGYVAYLGATQKEYYPKLKDDNGKVLKDDKGHVVKSETATGFMVSFATIGDSPKIVSAVFKDKLDLQPMGIYSLAGYGYNIQKANFIWLEEVESIKQVQIN